MQAMSSDGRKVIGRAAAALGLLALHLPFLIWVGSLWSEGLIAVQSIITPFIIAGLIYLRRAELPALRAPAPSGDRWGVALMGLGAVVGALSLGLGVLPLMAISLAVSVHGWLRWTRGAKAVAPFVVAIYMLVFLVPANHSALWGLSLWLQHVAAEIATLSMQWLAFPSFKDGVVVVTGATINVVTDDCSGMNTFTALLFYGLVFGFVFKLRSGYTLAVLATLLPLVLLTNGLRVAFICYLLYEYGEVVANGPLHDGSGIVIYALSFMVLFALMRLFKTNPSAQSSAQSATQPSPTSA